LTFLLKIVFVNLLFVCWGSADHLQAGAFEESMIGIQNDRDF